MKRTTAALSVLTAFVALTFVVSEAQGQPCCWGYRVRYYRIQPYYHYVYYAPQPPRWSVGLHGTALTTNQMFDNDPVAMGGLGGHIRYRGYRWAGEFAVDVVGGEYLGGQIQRLDVPIQLSALLYLIPEGRFNLYLLGGARVHATHVQIDQRNLHRDQNFAQFGLHGGGGAEIHLGRFVALTGDVRFFGLFRDDNSPSGQYYEGVDDGIVRNKSTGLQFNLGLSFRF
jgi:hypothetical protein